MNGNVYIGNPSSPTPGPTTSPACGSGTCSAAPIVRPRDFSDTTTFTVSVPSGSPWTLALADHSGNQPSATTYPCASANCTQTDTRPFGTQAMLPTPDVLGYLGQIETAVDMTPGGNPGNMTGTFQGSPVLNLSAIFATLGRNSDGTLSEPGGAGNCGCGSPGLKTGNCKVFCQIQPLGILKDPQNEYATASNSTPEHDYFVRGNTTNASELCNGSGGNTTCGHTGSVTTSQGGQADVNVFMASGLPPVILADGNIWFSNATIYGGKPVWGLRVSGRALWASTNDVYFSDNVLYRNGIGPKDANGRPTGCPTGSTDPACNPATADMFGIVAQRDIWYGDPIQGMFYEASAIMLAGRDFNSIFFKPDQVTPKPPDGNFILNGTMLANRQLAMFRDWAPTGSSTGTTCSSTGGQTGCLCPGGNSSAWTSGTPCQAVSFDPTDTTCGSSIGCYRFLVRDPIVGTVSYDTSKSSFKECGSSFSSCVAGSRRISHFQMNLNYDPRLFSTLLAPPGMQLNVQQLTGAQPLTTFANSWRDWGEVCPRPDAASCNPANP